MPEHAYDDKTDYQSIGYLCIRWARLDCLLANAQILFEVISNIQSVSYVTVN